MRARIGIVIAASTMIVVGAIVFYQQRTAGDADVRVTTERVAAALARGDRESLAREPLLQNYPDTRNWLLQQGPIGDYRVVVRRNGANRHQLLSSADVSHLGVIETASGVVCLGFWYDRESRQLRFVTASRSALG